MSQLQSTLATLMDAAELRPLSLEELEALGAELASEGDGAASFQAYAALGEKLRDAESAQRVWGELARHLDARAQAEARPVVAAWMWGTAADVLARQLKRRDDALLALQKAFARDPHDTWLERAQGLLDGRQHPVLAQALLQGRAALAASPAVRADAWAELGHMALLGGRSEEAEEHFARALDADPNCRRAREGSDILASLGSAREQRLQSLRGAVDRASGPSERAQALLRLGDALWDGDRRPEGGTEENAQDAAEAVAIWRQALEDHPAAGAVERLARAYEQRGQWESLAALHRRAAEELGDRPARLRSLKALARLAREGHGGEADNELAWLEAALALEGWDRDVLERLAALYEERQRWEELVEVLEKLRAQARAPEDSERLFRAIARLRWQRLGDWEGAHALYRRVRARSPRDAEVVGFFEAYYRREQDWPRLVSLLEQRLTGAEEDERLALAKQVAELTDRHLGDRAAAADAWRHVLELEPSDRRAQGRVEALLAEVGRWHALAEHHQRGAKEALAQGDAAENVRHLDALAALYTRADRLPMPELAADALRRLIEADPTRLAAYDELVRIYEQNGRWPDVAATLAARLERTPDGAVAIALRRRLAELAWRRGDLEAAFGWLERVAHDAPGEVEPLRRLQEIGRRLGRPEATYAHARAELALVPPAERGPLLRELAALAEDALGDAEAALGYWEELQQLDPAQPAVKQALERLYGRLGRWGELVELLAARLEGETARRPRAELLERLAEVVHDQLGDLQRAQELYAELLRLSPFHATARRRLVEGAAGSGQWAMLEAQFAPTGDWRGYLRALEDASRREENEHVAVELHLEIARVAEDKLNDGARAARALERVRELDPAQLDAARRLAPYYESRRNFRKHYDVLEVIALHATDPVEALEACRAAGRVAEQLREPSDALRWGCRAFAMDAERGVVGDVQHLLRLAAAASAFEPVVEALSGAAAALESNGAARLPVLLALAALLKERLGRAGDARMRFEDVLAVDPGNAVALDALAELAFAAADWPALADVLWRRVRALDGRPESRPYLMQLGDLYESFFDEPERACEVYQGLRALDPSDADALEGLRRIYSAQQRWTELVELLTADAERAPGDGVRADRLGRAARVYLERLDDVATALELASRAAALEDAQEDALAVLGALLDAPAAAAGAAHALEPIARRSGNGELLVRVLRARAGAEADADQRHALEMEAAGELERIEARRPEAFELYVELAQRRPDDLQAWEGAERGATSALAMRRLIEVMAKVTGVSAPGMAPKAGAAGELAPTGDAALRSHLLRRQAELLEHPLDEPSWAAACYEALLAYRPGDSELLAAAARLYAAVASWERWLKVQSQRLELVGQEHRLGLYQAMADVLEREMQRPAQAIAVLEEALADGGGTVVLDALERLYRSQDDVAGLSDLLRRRAAAAADPDELARLYTEVGLLASRRQGDPEAAAAALTKAVALRPDGEEATAELLRIATGEAGGALAEETANAAFAALELAMHALGRPEERVHILLARARRESGRDKARSVLAAAELLARELLQPKKAFQVALEALAAAPEQPEVLEAVVELARKPAGWSELADGLERAAATAMPAHRGRLLLALAQVTGEPLGQWGRSAAAYEARAELLGTDPEPWRLAALAWRQADAPERALAAVERQIELVPSAGRRALMREAAGLAQRVGAAEVAVGYLESLLTEGSAPEERIADMLALSGLYVELGRLEPQVGVLVELAELAQEPEEKAARWLEAAGIAEKELGSVENAAALLRRGREVLPDNVAVAYALARLERLSGRPLEAAQLLRWLEDVSPDAAGAARLERAALLEDGGQWREALSLYMELARSPEHARAALEAVERLAHMGEGEAATEAALAWRELAALVGDAKALASVQELLVERFSTYAEAPSEWERLAALQREVGDEVAALRSARRAYALAPDAEAAFELLASLAVANDPAQLAGAALDAAAAVPVGPQRRERLARAARALEGEGAHAELARELWTLVLEDEPADDEAYEELAAFFHAEENWHALSALLARRAAALPVGQRIAALYERAGVELGSLGDEQGAAAIYREILELEAGEANAEELLAGIYERAEAWADLAALWKGQLERRGEGGDRQDRLRRFARLLAERLRDGAGAEAAVAEVLAAAPGDAASHAVLERLREMGLLSAEGRRLLEATTEERRDWPLLFTLLQEDAGTATEVSKRLRLLERAADVAERRLGDFRRAYGVRKRLVQVDPTPARVERAERLAEATGAWADWVAFLVDASAEVPADGSALMLVRAAELFEGRLGQPAEAAELYQRVWEQHPEASSALRALERLYAGLGRWGDLVDALAASAPDVAEPRERAARYLRAAELAQEQMQDQERALDLTRRAVQADPASSEARRRLERLLIAAQSFDALEALYRQGVQSPDSAQDAAETAFKLAFLVAEKRGDAAEAVEWLGFTLGKQPGYKAAVRFLESLFDKAGSDALGAGGRPLKLVIADLLAAHYGPETAAERWLAVHQARVEFARSEAELAHALVAAGDTLRAQGQREAAFHRYATALRLAPEREETAAVAQALAEELGAQADLVDLFEEVGVLRDELRTHYRVRAARVAESMGLDDRAFELYAAVVAEVPDSAEAIAGMELAAERRGDRQGLREALRRRAAIAVEAAEQAVVYARLGRLAEADRDAVEALRSYEASLAADPQQPQIVDRLDGLYMAEDRWEEAAALLDRHLKRVVEPGRRVEVLSRLASVLDRHLGRLEEAVVCYREIFDLNPNSIYAIAGLERLAPKVGAWDSLVDVMERKRDLLANPRDQLAVDFQVAEMHHRHLGHREKALDFYRMVLARDETHAGALAALEELVEDDELRVPVALALEDAYERAGHLDRLAELWRRLLPLTDEPEERNDIEERLVDLYVQRLGRPQDALAVLQEGMRQGGPTEERLAAMEALATTGELWADALAGATEVLDELPPGEGASRLAFWLAGALEREVGDVDGAMRRYEDLLGDAAWHERALAAVEHLLEAEGRWVELYEILAGQVDAMPADQRRLVRLRLADIAEGQLDDLTAAFQWLKEVLGADPSDREVQLRLERLAEADPDLRGDVAELLMPLYEQQKLWAPLARLLDLQVASAVDADGRADAAMRGAAVLAGRLEQPGRALDRWFLALAEAPARMAGRLGELYATARSLGRLEDYAEGVERAAEKCADRSVALGLYRDVARVWAADLRRPERAGSAVARAVDTGMADVEALDAMARMLQEIGRWEDVAVVLHAKARLALPPEQREALLEELAQSCEHRGDVMGALEAYHQLAAAQPSRQDVLDRLEVLYAQTGDDSQLAALLERRARAAREAGQSAMETWLRLAELRENTLGDPDGAIEAFEAALAEQHGRAEALTGLERLYIETANWERLRDMLEAQAMVLDGQAKADVLRRLAEMSETELDDVDRAVDALEELLVLTPDDGEALDELLRLLHRHGRWEQLVAAYERKAAQTKIRSEKLALQVRQAEVLVGKLGQPEQAEAVIGRVLQEAPDQAQARVVLAEVREAQGMLDAARAILDNLYGKVPAGAVRQAVALRLASLHLREGGELPAAMLLLRDIVKADPAHREANELLRQALQLQGDVQGVVEVMKRQAGWAPTAAEQAARCREVAHMLAGQLHQPEEALHWLQKAHERAPDDEATAAELIDALRARGDSQKLEPLLSWMVARLEHQKATAELPERAHLLGRVREKLGRRDDALLAYRVAYRHDPTYLPNLLSMGRLLLGMGDVEQATGIYQAMQLQAHGAPDNVKVEIFHTLGRIYLQKGDSSRARQYFQRVLRIDRHHQPTLDGMKRLPPE